MGPCWVRKVWLGVVEQYDVGMGGVGLCVPRWGAVIWDGVILGGLESWGDAKGWL